MTDILLDKISNLANRTDNYHRETLESLSFPEIESAMIESLQNGTIEIVDEEIHEEVHSTRIQVYKVYDVSVIMEIVYYQAKCNITFA